MADLDGFRAETGAWLEESAPKTLVGLRVDLAEGAWGGRRPNWKHPDQALWLERAAQRGFTAPTWPTAYGGGGLSTAEAKIVDQEIRARRLPLPLTGFGLEMIGPTLLRFATEEQKRDHVTKITRGEIRWCQGYSEPDAGSDLASLQMKAVRDGDDFIVTGQKVWTSYADASDWIFALVRTDPDAKKQAGITRDHRSDYCLGPRIRIGHRGQRELFPLPTLRATPG